MAELDFTRRSVSVARLQNIIGLIFRGQQLAKTPGRRSEADRWLNAARRDLEHIAGGHEEPVATTSVGGTDG